MGNLKSPDATFAEITGLDGPELVVNLVVQAVESCYNSLTRTQNQEAFSSQARAFDKLTMLLRDFPSVVSRIDGTVAAVYEKIQGECSSLSAFAIY